MQEFADRRDAGAHLALALQGYAERPDVTVVALRRGGIPVGYELAVRLGLPLVVADDTGQARLEQVGTEIQGRTIIVSVDGVETAPPLVASLTALRRFDPAEIVAAIPVACGNTCAIVAAHVDDMVCLVTTPRAVELSYLDFSPSSDHEEQRLIEDASREWRELSLHGSHGW